MSRYIDIEWLKKKKRFDSKQQRHIVRMTDIYSAPSIDIVRCRECKRREEYPCKVYHDDDWYCADGERREP